MMPWDSLWILPFLVLAVRRWWVLIIWAVAETAFAIAIHLGDVAAIEPDKGLEPTFVALLDSAETARSRRRRHLRG